MGSLQFERASFGYAGGDEVVREVSLACGEGWTAVVGDNGAGKSTLLRLAAGELAPVAGVVRRVGLDAIAMVDQRVDVADPAIEELASRSDRGGVRWRGRLALDPDALARWPTLSPGERKRWQLAAALAREPDLLIVDEPSNHLDGEALARCRDALASFRGVGLVVSHDRALLDRLPRQIVRVHGGEVRAWPGNYAAARAAWQAETEANRERKSALSADRRRAERQVAAAREVERQATRSVSTRVRSRSKHDADARSMPAKNLAQWAAAAAGRSVDRLHTRAEAARRAEAAVHVERTRGAALAVGWEAPPRRWLVELARPALRAGERTIARDVRLAIGREARIWLRGPNGSGKSTLIAALVAASTLPAERLLVLPQDTSAADGAALARALRGLDREQRGRLGQLADALGIDPDRALRSELPSPGEVRKLLLALGLIRRPWLVLLDEPTNHLDLPSIERLEAALREFPGAIVVATHDATLAAAICTTTWSIEQQRIEPFSAMLSDPLS